MSGVLKNQITETAQELKDLIDVQQDPIVKERLQVLYGIKTFQAESVNHLAVLAGRHPTTINRWLGEYRRSGMKSLFKVGKSSGRTKAIAPDIRPKIEEELKAPEGFTSYGEIHAWVRNCS